MPYIHTGKIIREFRVRRNITQARLCEGICEPSTLCKIEGGRQNPNKKQLDALIARLQIPVALNVPVSAIEFERAQLEKDILWHLSRGDYGISTLLERYREAAPAMDRFERQVYLFARAVYREHAEPDYDAIMEELLEAVRITFPGYTVGMDITEHLFIPLEVSILNNIATCLHFLRQNGAAIALMEQLMACLNGNAVPAEDYIRKFPMIAYNLSLWLGTEKEYGRSLSVAEAGIACCFDHENFSLLPHLLYNKGYTLMCMGRDGEGAALIKEALFAMKIHRQTAMLRGAEEDIIASFGESFWRDVQRATLSELG